MKDKYLKITLHDNDFNWELQNVCRLLSMYLPNTKTLASIQERALTNLTTDSNTLNDNDSILVLRDIIIDALCMFHKLQHMIKYNDGHDYWGCGFVIDYFTEQLDISIVDKDDIPDWNNDEDFCIRLFNYYTNELEWFFV